jgi:hypothetical protein
MASGNWVHFHGSAHKGRENTPKPTVKHRHFIISTLNKLKSFWVAIAVGTISLNQLKAVTIFDANFDNCPFNLALSSNAVTTMTDLGTPSVGTWSFSNFPVGRITVNSNHNRRCHEHD